VSPCNAHISSCYNFIPNIFCFLMGGGCTTEKLYIIHGQILCRVVKCGQHILWTFKNPYDPPQHVIIHTRPNGQIFILFNVVLNRDICEWGTGKNVVLAYFTALSNCVPGMTKDHNENSESRYLPSGSTFWIQSKSANLSGKMFKKVHL
jgi:hypothetical protein